MVPGFGVCLRAMEALPFWVTPVGHIYVDELPLVVEDWMDLVTRWANCPVWCSPEGAKELILEERDTA